MSIKSTLKFSFSLSIIAFYSVSKWWYALVEDAPTSVMKGFPLPYRCQGWHTSMSYQYFWKAFILDLLSYYILAMALSYTLLKIFKWKLPNRLTNVLLILSLSILSFNVSFMFSFDNLNFWDIDFKFQTKETSIQWFNEVIERPEWRDDFVPYEWDK